MHRPLALPDLDDIASARVSLGVEATGASGVSIALHGDVSGLGSSAYTAYGAAARVDLPF